MRKNQFSIIYKSVFAILLITGVLARAGLFGGELALHTLYSFTSISNFFVFIITLITIYSIKFKKQLKLYRMRLLGLIMILITGLIYHFILLPEKIIEYPNYQFYTYGNIVAHYISPFLMLLDWLLFDEKGKLSKWDPLICIIIPTFYFIIASVFGYLGSTLPNKKSSYVYFFMDFDQLGVLGVMKWCGIILIVIVSLIYTIYFIAYFMNKSKQNKNQKK